MTTEQWNAIDEALVKYEEYEKKVREYLLFLMGYHTKTELKKYMDDAPRQIEQLMKARSSETAELLSQFTGMYGKFKNVQLNASEGHRMVDVHSKFLNISRNTMSWLNAAELYCGLLTENEIIAK